MTSALLSDTAMIVYAAIAIVCVLSGILVAAVVVWDWLKGLRVPLDEGDIYGAPADVPPTLTQRELDELPPISPRVENVAIVVGVVGAAFLYGGAL